MSYLVTPGPPIDLDDGRVAAEGETVTNVDSKQEHNRRLIDAGRLVEIKRAKTTEKEKA